MKILCPICNGTGIKYIGDDKDIECPRCQSLGEIDNEHVL